MHILRDSLVIVLGGIAYYYATLYFFFPYEVRTRVMWAAVRWRPTNVLMALILPRTRGGPLELVSKACWMFSTLLAFVFAYLFLRLVG